MTEIPFFIAEAVDGANVILGSEERRHAVKSLRMGCGDRFFATEGKGVLYECEITEIGKEKFKGRILNEKRFPPNRFTLRIAFSLLKHSERMEWMVEKCTEIGVRAFIPVLSRNTVKKGLNRDRLKKKIIAACKQSKKVYFPQLEEITTFEQLITRDFRGVKYIAHCSNSENKQEIQKSPYTEALVLVGPEGDFEPAEVKQAIACNFKELSLGETRLRSETACIYAASVFMHENRIK